MSTRSTAKKTLQNFHARTTLWKLFEIRAQEMDCSIDYLINEAMRLYATTHAFLEADDTPPGSSPGTDEGRATEELGAMSLDLKATVPGRSVGSGAALPRPGGGPPPLRPGNRPSSPPTLPRPPGSGVSRPPVPRPPAAEVTAAPTGTGSNLPGLTLIFQGKKIPITTGQFIIGRGSKASDLAIKDANISRKHAAIIFHNGAYYLKDLGSTNGIEYKGKQVDSKRIDEGDVFAVCGYELHFTYGV